MHLAGPLAVAGVGEVLAEAGGAAEVDRQHRIAAIGQPLVVAAVAIGIARPWAAVDQQHQRHRRIGLPVVVRVGAARQGQVADQGLVVARSDFHRPLRDQRLAFQLGSRGKELGQRAGAAVVAVVDQRRFGRRVRDDPGLVVQRARVDGNIARSDRLQLLQVGPDRGVDHLPLVAQVIHRHGLHLARCRVGQRAADVGACVFQHQRARAAGHVDREQRCRVAAARIGEVQRLAVQRQATGTGGQHVLERDVVELLPRPVGAAPQHIGATVRARALRVLEGVVGVGDVAGDLRVVLLQQRAVAAGQIDLVDVVPLRVAVVHADQDRAGVFRADAGDLGGGLRERCQVLRLTGLQVHGIQMEVLVAAAVAQVQQRVGLVGPEVAADAARLVLGDGPGLRRVVGRGDPDVEHAIDGGDPAEVLAVGADLHVGAFGVAEQRVARDQFGTGDAVGGGRRGLRGEGERDSRGQQREAECGVAHGRTPGWRSGNSGQDVRRHEV